MDWNESDRDTIEPLVKLAEFDELITDAVRQAEGGMDLTDSVSVVMLCRLELGRPLRPTDIMEFSGLTSGGVAKAVSRLEAVGLVTRRYGARVPRRQARCRHLIDSKG